MRQQRRNSDEEGKHIKYNLSKKLVQWLRICLVMQGMWIWSQGRELDPTWLQQLSPRATTRESVCQLTLMGHTNAHYFKRKLKNNYWPCCVACGALVPRLRIKPTPLRWKCRGLQQRTAREVPDQSYFLTEIINRIFKIIWNFNPVILLFCCIGKFVMTVIYFWVQKMLTNFRNLVSVYSLPIVNLEVIKIILHIIKMIFESINATFLSLGSYPSDIGHIHHKIVYYSFIRASVIKLFPTLAACSSRNSLAPFLIKKLFIVIRCPIISISHFILLAQFLNLLSFQSPYKTLIKLP